MLEAEKLHKHINFAFHKVALATPLPGDECLRQGIGCAALPLTTSASCSEQRNAAIMAR